MKQIFNIVIAVGLIVAAVYITRRWFPSERVITETTQTTDTIWQDSIVYKQLPAPDPDTVHLTDTVIEYQDSVDYFAEYKYLYKLYHRENIYNRVLKDDSSAYIYVGDKVTENKLQRFDFSYIDRTPTTINITSKKVYNENKLFVGGEVGMHTLQPSVIYQSENDIMYQIGYDFANPSGVRAGVYVRLW